MAGNPNSVLQGRRIKVWQKDYAASAAMPANTVESQAAITGYTDRGYSDGGIGFSTEQQRTGVGVDQVAAPLYYIDGELSVRMTANLAELDPDNIQLAAGVGAVTTTAPAVGVRGQVELIVPAENSPEINSWLGDIAQPINGLPFRFLIPKGQSTGGISANVSPTQKGLANLVVTALPDESFTPARLLVVRQVTPAA